MCSTPSNTSTLSVHVLFLRLCSNHIKALCLFLSLNQILPSVAVIALFIASFCQFFFPLVIHVYFSLAEYDGDYLHYFWLLKIQRLTDRIVIDYGKNSCPLNSRLVAWVTRIEDLCEHWLEVFINTIVEPKVYQQFSTCNYCFQIDLELASC